MWVGTWRWKGGLSEQSPEIVSSTALKTVWGVGSTRGLINRKTENILQRYKKTNTLIIGKTN